MVCKYQIVAFLNKKSAKTNNSASYISKQQKLNTADPPKPSWETSLSRVK